VASPTLRRYALDHNFPKPIIDHFRTTPFAVLVPLSEIDGGWLTDVDDDWAVLVALYQLGFDGLITNDDAMIELPKELAVLMQLRMLLVVLARSNRDMLETTGLLLLHIRRIIAKRTSHAQIVVLNAPPAASTGEDIRERFKERARHKKRPDHRKYAAELQLAPKELTAPLRDWYTKSSELAPRLF
jgi:hypothetical protein